MQIHTARASHSSIWIFAFALTVLAGCASSGTSTSEKKPQAQTPTTAAQDTTREKINRILRWLDATSQRARSMNASGSISLEQAGDGQSAQFAIHSKRLVLENGASGRGSRMDSLSVEVVGPFGIKLAKFLASPAHYYFFNALLMESVDGPTDAYSLEQLTQLKGVSLPTMSDVLYGLAPQADVIAAEDSVSLVSKGDHHSLIIHRTSSHRTELLALSGPLPSYDASVSTDFSLRAYTRWNRDVDPMAGGGKPDVIVHYGAVAMHDGVPIPKTIEASAGTNKLTLEYSDIAVNPRQLTVFIKVPKK